MKRSMIFISVFLITHLSYAQINDPPNKEDVSFLMHLNTIQNHEETEFLIEEINLNTIERPSLLDTLNYLMGWSRYNQKDLKESAASLLEVSEQSSFYEKARFFAAYNYTHSNHYDEGKEILKDLRHSSTHISKLKNFELAGISLLERNYEAFSQYSVHFKQDYYPIAGQEKNLIQISHELMHQKTKSPFLAASLSTILPGSGKIYAGKTGEGISSFLIVGSLAAVTAENYFKNGITNPKTILFGGIFSVFYIGNILGSYHSISIANKKFNDKKNSEILYNLHIPLRTVFN